MKKFIIFFKNLKYKLYNKLIEILVDAEMKKMPKKLEEDFRELKEQFSFFNVLNPMQKVCMIFGGIIISLIVIYWHFALIMMILKVF